MPDYMIWVIAIIILVLVVWVVFAKVLKNKKLGSSNVESINIDMEAFFKALGGKENIDYSEATNSKITVFLQEDTNVKVEELKKLGASGIVQNNGKVTIILGKTSMAISDYINQEK